MSRAIALYRETGFKHVLALNLIFQARGLAAADQPHEAIAVLARGAAPSSKVAAALLRCSDVTDVLARLHLHFALRTPADMTPATAATIASAKAALSEKGRRVEGWKTPDPALQL